MSLLSILLFVMDIPKDHRHKHQKCNKEVKLNFIIVCAIHPSFIQLYMIMCFYFYYYLHQNNICACTDTHFFDHHLHSFTCIVVIIIIVVYWTNGMSECLWRVLFIYISYLLLLGDYTLFPILWKLSKRRDCCCWKFIERLMPVCKCVQILYLFLSLLLLI
jgi:hypothetical protein